MRINIYNEELTERIEFNRAQAKTGAHYYGLYFYLHSAEQLHSGPNDEVSSAVVFWSDSREKLLTLLAKATEAIKKSGTSK